jgi:hypothetical protein
MEHSDCVYPQHTPATCQPTRPWAMTRAMTHTGTLVGCIRLWLADKNAKDCMSTAKANTQGPGCKTHIQVQVVHFAFRTDALSLGRSRGAPATLEAGIRTQMQPAAAGTQPLRTCVRPARTECGPRWPRPPVRRLAVDKSAVQQLCRWQQQLVGED